MSLQPGGLKQRHRLDEKAESDTNDEDPNIKIGLCCFEVFLKNNYIKN